MTDKERRFKIKKIKKYEKEIDKERTCAIVEICTAGICAALAINAGSGAIMLFETFFYGFVGTTSVLAIFSLVIENFAKIAKLEGLIEQYKNDIAINNLENKNEDMNEKENGGITR